MLLCSHSRSSGGSQGRMLLPFRRLVTGVSPDIPRSLASCDLTFFPHSAGRAQWPDIRAMAQLHCRRPSLSSFVSINHNLLPPCRLWLTGQVVMSRWQRHTRRAYTPVQGGGYLRLPSISSGPCLCPFCHLQDQDQMTTVTESLLSCSIDARGALGRSRPCGQRLSQAPP